MTQVHFLVAVAVSLLAALTSSTALVDAFGDARAVYDRGDFGSARPMFEPLANSGDRKAQTMMGNIYCYARGVPQDWDKAGEWYRKAADQGEPVAQFSMFFVLRRSAFANFHSGQRPPDDSEGFAYLLKAAAQDHPGAMWAVSSEYERPPRKNDPESFSWLRKAADLTSWQSKPLPAFGTIPETAYEAERMLQFNGLYAR